MNTREIYINIIKPLLKFEGEVGLTNEDLIDNQNNLISFILGMIVSTELTASEIRKLVKEIKKK